MRALGLTLLVVLAAAAPAAAAPASDPASDPVPAVVPTDPAAGLTGRPIPASVGARRDRLPFSVNVGSTPAPLDPARFLALARDSGERWGSRFQGTTNRRPVQDGHDTIAFDRQPRDVLGTTIDWLEPSFARRCTGAGRRRSCTRRRTGWQSSGERDMQLNAAVAWAQGPAHPAADQYDLQSVLIHEFGHFAGNDHQVGACLDTPMLASGGPGEWWRAEDDWWRPGCGMAARRALAVPRPMHVRHVEIRTCKRGCKPS